MNRSARRLKAVPVTTPPIMTAHVPHGGCSLENADRIVYQSARVKTGLPIPPLPLTESQAWAAALAGTGAEE